MLLIIREIISFLGLGLGEIGKIIINLVFL